MPGCRRQKRLDRGDAPPGSHEPQHLLDDFLGPGLVHEERLTDHEVEAGVGPGHRAGVCLLGLVPPRARRGHLFGVSVEADEVREPQQAREVAVAAAQIGRVENRIRSEQGAQALRPRALPEVLSKGDAQKATPALIRTVCACSLMRPRCVIWFSFG